MGNLKDPSVPDIGHSEVDQSADFGGQFATLKRERLDDSVYLVHGLPTQTAKWLAKMYSKGMLRLVEGEYRVDPSLHAVIPFLTDQELINV